MPQRFADVLEILTWAPHALCHDYLEELTPSISPPLLNAMISPSGPPQKNQESRWSRLSGRRIALECPNKIHPSPLLLIDEAHKADKPFFVWYNTTAMHFRTHCAAKHKGKSGHGDYNDVMVAHDENIGTMLKKLDDLGIAEDTIVMYSTDNGVYYNICTAMLCRAGRCRRVRRRQSGSDRLRIRV